MNLILVYAAATNSVELLEDLVRRGAKINAQVNKNDVNAYPLVTAAEYGSYSATKWLLDHGATIEARSCKPVGPGQTSAIAALWLAAMGGFVRRILRQD